MFDCDWSSDVCSSDLPMKFVASNPRAQGLLVLVAVIFLGGLLATNFIGRRIVAFWERVLQRVPLVRGIYTTIKSMMDVLSFQDQNKGAAHYSRVVMIEFPRKGQYALALVTGVTAGEVQDISTDRVVNVYVPTSPNPTSGYLLFVPESELIPVNMSVDEATKMMFSGGMYTPRVPEAVGAGTGREKRASGAASAPLGVTRPTSRSKRSQCPISRFVWPWDSTPWYWRGCPPPGTA